MATLIVGEERDLTQLNRRVFRPRVSGEVKAKLTEAIRAANPHVDLDHLEPGTVLTIPDAPEIRVKDEISLDEITKRAIAEASSVLRQTLDDLEAAQTEERKQAKADRARLRTALKSRKVGAAGERNKQVVELIDAAQQQLEVEEQRSQEEKALAKKAFAQWSKDLEQLRSRLPD